MSSIVLRSPSEPNPSIAAPKLDWLEGTWNVTHSTLPMWKKNRNVQITYTRIPGTSPPHIDDLVTYQSLSSDSKKTVRGVDKPFPVLGGSVSETEASLGYHWRGKGWLVIASSKWEILGYGIEEGSSTEWAVTFFAKTLFTPTGVDIYSRNGFLREDTLSQIKEALTGLEGDIAGLSKDVFAVRTDGLTD
ncbi:hypothetical protein B0J11DRAFT_542178 [Dendryphion nanum]|uniref:Uncharacterized protein n=1 Tax=Dendryphion nanum TaxID=256645 RepID=A0A9P9D535_9PLEO|nr:hypothetical protein B0J11DRAFT_542178 [Dendryphion nanum]